MYDVLCLSKASQQKTRRSCVMTLYLMTSSNQCWPHLQACCTCHHRRHDLRQYQPGRDIKQYQLCSNFISFNARNHTSQKSALKYPIPGPGCYVEKSLRDQHWFKQNEDSSKCGVKNCSIEFSKNEHSSKMWDKTQNTVPSSFPNNVLTVNNNSWTFLINVRPNGLLHLSVHSLLNNVWSQQNRVFELNIQSNRLPILWEGSKTQIRRQISNNLGSTLLVMINYYCLSSSYVPGWFSKVHHYLCLCQI